MAPQFYSLGTILLMPHRYCLGNPYFSLADAILADLIADENNQ